MKYKPQQQKTHVPELNTLDACPQATPPSSGSTEITLPLASQQAQRNEKLRQAFTTCKQALRGWRRPRAKPYFLTLTTDPCVPRKPYFHTPDCSTYPVREEVSSSILTATPLPADFQVWKMLGKEGVKLFFLRELLPSPHSVCVPCLKDYDISAFLTHLKGVLEESFPFLIVI